MHRYAFFGPWLGQHRTQGPTRGSLAGTPEALLGPPQCIGASVELSLHVHDRPPQCPHLAFDSSFVLCVEAKAIRMEWKALQTLPRISLSSGGHAAIAMRAITERLPFQVELHRYVLNY